MYGIRPLLNLPKRLRIGILTTRQQRLRGQYFLNSKK